MSTKIYPTYNQHIQPYGSVWKWRIPTNWRCHGENDDKPVMFAGFPLNVQEKKRMVFFHSWGYPNSWMVYNGKFDNQMDDLGVSLFQEKTYRKNSSTLPKPRLWRQRRCSTTLLPLSSEHTGRETCVLCNGMAWNGMSTGGDILR